MARYVAWAFAALLLVPAATSAAGVCEKGQNQGKPVAPKSDGSKPDSGHQPSKWWVDPKLRAEFGITDQQSALIEAIWRKDLQQRTETRTRLESMETQLDQMLLDAALDETAFMAQLEKVEAARTEASKARMLMLYRINKVLTTDQRAKLAAKAKAMREQRDGGRGDHR
jgi:Spy/CpxP family protein refolding chaperone